MNNLEPKSQTLDPITLLAQRNALLEACKAALLRLDHHDEQSAPEALQLRNAIALAQGADK